MSKLDEIPEIKFQALDDVMLFELLDITSSGSMSPEELAYCVLRKESGVQVEETDDIKHGIDLLDRCRYPRSGINNIRSFYIEECGFSGRILLFDFSKPGEDWIYVKPTEALVDFRFWAELPCWTAGEAVALSLGRSPNVVNEASFTAAKRTQYPKLADEFFHRAEFVNRAVSVGDLSSNIPPRSFVDWAGKKELVIHDELLSHVVDPAIDRPNDLMDSSDLLQERERDSLLKLILGMSVDRYGYRVGEKRNSATGDKGNSIAARLESLGIRLDSDTIRKYLKEAEDRFGDLVDEPDR